jgi:hypothetical protein
VNTCERRGIYLNVCNALGKQLKRYTATDIWVSGNYDATRWKPLLDAETDKIKRIQTWARALDDVRVRREYLEWLDFYEKGIREAWRELETKEQLRLNEDYAKQRAADELCRQSVTVPEPPR